MKAQFSGLFFKLFHRSDMIAIAQAGLCFIEGRQDTFNAVIADVLACFVSSQFVFVYIIRWFAWRWNEGIRIMTIHLENWRKSGSSLGRKEDWIAETTEGACSNRNWRVWETDLQMGFWNEQTGLAYQHCQASLRKRTTWRKARGKRKASVQGVCATLVWSVQEVNATTIDSAKLSPTA